MVVYDIFHDSIVIVGAEIDHEVNVRAAVTIQNIDTYISELTQKLEEATNIMASKI